MYQHSNEGVSIKSILDERRKLQDGGYPVKIRVTYNRKRKYYSTDVSLTVKEWEGLGKAKGAKAKERKMIVQETFDKIKSATNGLIDEGMFSIELLNNRLGRGDVHFINLVFKDKINTLIENEQHGTSQFYSHTLKALEGFAGNEVDPRVITPEWLVRFESHLLGKGRSYTTIAMYMRSLRAMMNSSRKLGLIKAHQYPFGLKNDDKYQIPEHASRKIALSLNQIGEIYNFECRNKTERYNRDLWFFSYLCNGANLSDIARLTKENVKENSIQFYRQKTLSTSRKKKEIVAALTPEMKQIISDHGSKENDSKYLFPILTGREDSLETLNAIKAFTRAMNHYMCDIGAELGIGKITSYTARHSFASVLKRSGTNILFISESLGHTDLKTTDNYLASFEDEERNKNAKLLTNF